MTIITASPVTVNEMIDARVDQAETKLHNKYMSMLDGTADEDAWSDVLWLTEDYATASLVQRQLFTIEHHLAKTILSTV